MDKRGLYWFLSLFLVPFAYAQGTDNYLTEPFQIVSSLFKEATAGENFFVSAYLILGIIIFAAAYGGLQALRLKKNIATAIAFGFTGLALFGMPTSFVRTIFDVYHGVVGIVLLVALIVALFFLGRMLRRVIGEHRPLPFHIAQAVVYALTLGLIQIISNSIKTDFSVLGVTLPWINLIRVLCLLLLFYHILMIIFSLVGGGRGRFRWPFGGWGGGPGRDRTEGGPGEIVYHEPNLVRGITICTHSADPATGNGRIQVNWSVTPEIMTNERIDNFEIKILPSRFISTPGWGSRWRRLTGGRLLPFARAHHYSAESAPFVIPEDFPIGAEVALEVRAHNTVGFGPRSDKARIVIGTNMCDGSPPVAPTPRTPPGAPQIVNLQQLNGPGSDNITIQWRQP